MSDELTLEVELDLPLDREDIARYRAYIVGGAPSGDACPADRMRAYATANEIAAKRGKR